MKPFWIAALVLALVAAAGPAGALPAPRPTPQALRAEIHQSFEEIRAHAPWSAGTRATWTFFFSADDRATLETAASGLEAMGFTVADLTQIAPATPYTPADWSLSVAKLATYMEQSLFDQEQALYDFAAQHRLAHNGRDVGPASDFPQPALGAVPSAHS